MTKKKCSYIIGDIHGCYKEYLELEKAVFKHADGLGFEPLIISVGDLFDRGPQSKNVLEHFACGLKEETHIVVMGNHESEFLRIVEATRPDLFSRDNLKLPSSLPSLKDDFDRGRLGSDVYDSYDEFHEMFLLSWRSQGGHETLTSYGLDPHSSKSWDFPENHLRTLINLPLVWSDANYVVTHALAEANDLAAISSQQEHLSRGEGNDISNSGIETYQFAAQSCLWNRRAPKQRLDPNRVHISGHTPMDAIGGNSQLAYIQIDTACVYGKRLTAYCTEDSQVISVKSKTSWSR